MSNEPGAEPSIEAQPGAQPDPQAQAQEQPQAQPQIDAQKLHRKLSELRSKQNLALGALAGAGAAVVGAGGWALVTVLTNYQLGIMAVAIGCAVGMAVRKFGQGIDKPFGIIGAIEALLGCLAGNLLTVCAVISKEQAIPLIDVLSRLTPDLVVTLMCRTFNGMDLVFYGIAVYEGYKFSFHKLTPSEIDQLKKETS